MYCKNCGHEVAPDAGFCPNCGAAVSTDVTQTQTPPPPPYAGQPYWQGQPPYGQPCPPLPTKPSALWLVFNIVLMVFSGFTNLFAIVGIVMGALGQSAYNHGDYKDAENKTKACKALAIISLVLFLLFLAICFIMVVFMGVTSSPNGNVYFNL